MADQRFLEGVTLGTRRELRGSGLTGEFYTFVNQDVGIISNVYIALMGGLFDEKVSLK